MLPFTDLQSHTRRPGRLKAVWIRAADGRMECVWVSDCELDLEAAEPAAEPLESVIGAS